MMMCIDVLFVYVLGKILSLGFFDFVSCLLFGFFGGWYGVVVCCCFEFDGIVEFEFSIDILVVG